MTVIKYIMTALGVILLYEAARAIVLGAVRARLYRSVKEYLDEHRIRLDRYKFMHKVVVKQELLNDVEIHQGIIEHSREKNLKIKDVQNQVEEYIEEIVPFFNLLSYYKMGYSVANSILNMLYEVVIDRENAEKLKKIPKDSVVVFVMNHRSNIDYILVAYMLAQQISLSYAVGEWARVWPLEYIFKSFGAYFIRRRFRENLYHLVLEKYVQLISLQGVTQGIFLEGGLSRDGSFRAAKIGILDYIIRIKKNPEFKRDLVFVPAAINYDWVLEDRTLIEEWKKGKEKSGFRDNLRSLVRIAGKGPLLVIANLLRYLTGRLKRHGYASVSFGDPVFLSDFISRQKDDIFKLERHDRLERVQGFADGLMRSIGAVIPVSPVCITARALTLLGKKEFLKSDLIRTVARLRKQLKDKNCRIVLGRAFESGQRILSRLESERPDRKKELVTFEEELLEFDEAMQTVDVAIDLLKRRGMILHAGDRYTINEKKMPLVEYYSNAVAHLV